MTDLVPLAVEVSASSKIKLAPDKFLALSSEDPHHAVVSVSPLGIGQEHFFGGIFSGVVTTETVLSYFIMSLLLEGTKELTLSGASAKSPRSRHRCPVCMCRPYRRTCNISSTWLPSDLGRTLECNSIG